MKFSHYLRGNFKLYIYYIRKVSICHYYLAKNIYRPRYLLHKISSVAY